MKQETALSMKEVRELFSWMNITLLYLYLDISGIYL